MLTQDCDRSRSAKRLNSLSLDELFENWGITQVRLISGLDIIGIPVYSAYRPNAISISVYAGKNEDPALARAGAIAEAIEYATFEAPPEEVAWGKFSDYDRIPISNCFEGFKEIPLTAATRVYDNTKRLLPAHLFTLSDLGVPRIANSFQRNSSGQAVGPSFADALLAGLYECIERDAITLWSNSARDNDYYPRRLKEFGAGPERLSQKIREAGLNCFLFDARAEFFVPVVFCVITENSPSGYLCSGWGTDLDLTAAQAKAILEAAQSRATFISGARDDIKKSHFELFKAQDTRETTKAILAQPFSGYGGMDLSDKSASAKLGLLCRLLGHWWKHVYIQARKLAFNLCAVKSFILGLEQPLSEDWVSNGRRLWLGR